MTPILHAVRYLTPLREGSSLPGLIDADDGERYVVKFSGAGQGPKALIAEWIAGQIAQALGLRVPKIALIELDNRLGRSEPDPEIRELLLASSGMNLGLRFLPEAYGYDVLLKPPPDPDLASAIVWFDAYVTNVDRTPRNVNLLVWHDDLWLIDHGAALYFHHRWGDYMARSTSPFAPVRDHALLPFADRLWEADERLRQKLDRDLLRGILAQLPAEWLTYDAPFADEAAHREAYVDYLANRLAHTSTFVQEAVDAHAALV